MTSHSYQHSHDKTTLVFWGVLYNSLREPGSTRFCCIHSISCVTTNTFPAALHFGILYCNSDKSHSHWIKPTSCQPGLLHVPIGLFQKCIGDMKAKEGKTKGKAMKKHVSFGQQLSQCLLQVWEGKPFAPPTCWTEQPAFGGGGGGSFKQSSPSTDRGQAVS